MGVADLTTPSIKDDHLELVMHNASLESYCHYKNGFPQRKYAIDHIKDAMQARLPFIELAAEARMVGVAKAVRGNI